MTLNRWTFPLFACAALLATPPAGAVVTVLDGGLGRDCYLAVRSARAPYEAIETCTRAIEESRLRTRDRAATYANRGIVFMRLGDLDRAIRDFERSLDLQPDLLETKINYGAALCTLKRYPEALALLDDGVAAEDFESRAIAHYNRAIVREAMGDVEGAYADYSAALETNPLLANAARQLERFRVVTPGEG